MREIPIIKSDNPIKTYRNSFDLVKKPINAILKYKILPKEDPAIIIQSSGFIFFAT